EEYEGVEVATASVRARTYGQGIVEEARRRGVEAIVLAAEEPTRMRGGRRLGGRGGPRNRAGGETTRDVIEKAPCRVILTAPPPGEDHGGQFTVGTALELDALLAAGIENADAFVAATDGDNTNLVIAQIAKRRYDIEKVVVRVLDPMRAQWYEDQGLLTVCPTQKAIEMLQEAV